MKLRHKSIKDGYGFREEKKKGSRVNKKERVRKAGKRGLRVRLEERPKSYR